LLLIDIDFGMPVQSVSKYWIASLQGGALGDRNPTGV
jgi:hypothetical protein